MNARRPSLNHLVCASGMDLRRKNLRRRGNRVKDNRSRTSALEKIDRLEWVVKRPSVVNMKLLSNNKGAIHGYHY
jgi:hypothetical protein